MRTILNLNLKVRLRALNIWINLLTERYMAFLDTTPYIEMINECLIDGKRLHYDCAVMGDLEQKIKSLGHKFKYIGSGCTTYHNNRESKCTDLYHFFIEQQLTPEIRLMILTDEEKDLRKKLEENLENQRFLKENLEHN